MKKLSVLLLSMIFISTLVGCGLFGANEESSATETPMPTSTPETSKDESDDLDSSDEESSAEKEDESSDEKESSTNESEDDNSLGSETNNISMGTFYEDLKTVYGDDYTPDTELDSAQIEERLGLSPDLYDDIYAHTKDGNPDIFVAVKAKSGASGDVERALSSYKDKLAMDEAYADKSDKINSAKVYVEGDYVFLVLLGADTPQDGDFNAQTQKGIDEIKKRFE